jgi:hypothetical protein
MGIDCLSPDSQKEPMTIVVAPTKLAILGASTSVVSVVALALTPSEISYYTIAVATLITSLFAGIVSVIVALRTGRTEEKLDKVDTTAEVIKGHVDGMTTKAAVTIESQQRELTMLRTQLADKDRAAALLAQTAAVKDLKP